MDESFEQVMNEFLAAFLVHDRATKLDRKQLFERFDQLLGVAAELELELRSVSEHLQSIRNMLGMMHLDS